MPRDLGERIFEPGERTGLAPAIWSPDSIYAGSLDHRTDLLGEMAGGEVVQQRDLRTVDPDRIYKFSVLGDREQLDEIQPYMEENYPELRRSSPLFFETSTPGATKLEGLLHCLEGVDVLPEHTVGVADGDNDIDFITRVGLGVAVENAYPRLKELADLRIGHVDDDSTAIFLEDLFELEPYA